MVRAAACLAVWLLAATLRGDIPLPPNLHYVDPVVQFEGTAKLADYEFRLRFTSFVGAPTNQFTYREVPDSKSFNLNAARRLGKMQLLGLKRDEFQRRAKEDPTLAWLTDETPDVLAADVEPPSTVAPVNKPAPVTKYRVLLKDGKLTVEQLDAPQDEKKVGVAPRWSTWISGLALSLACGGFGLWAVRHRRASQFV